MKIEINKEYKYSHLEEVLGEDFDMEDIGRFSIGENFLVFRHTERDITISFVLTGTMGEDSIYKCIYKE